VCGLRVFFEDPACTGCGHVLVYDVAADDFVLGRPSCANAGGGLACNWAAEAGWALCLPCSIVEPSPSVQLAGVAPYHRAVRRALRQLAAGGVNPIGLQPPLRFVLRNGSVEDVTIGHADGVITLDTAESDPAHQEATRTRLGEPYRTVLGHVRHELGHWHWQAVVSRDAVLMMRFGALFGDSSADYAAALEEHYGGDQDDDSWRGEYLSYYASAHPWEDYAETFAHALLITDTLETCQSIGVIPAVGRRPDEVLGLWGEVSVSLNELNRSMGKADPYPFAPSPPARRKLAFLLDILAPR
jgi:hypothetical protein